MADYAKRCGIGGIFHTDELPAYGITAADVQALRAQAGAGEEDCVVLVAGSPDQAACAADQVMRRAGGSIKCQASSVRRGAVVDPQNWTKKAAY